MKTLVKWKYAGILAVLTVISLLVVSCTSPFMEMGNQNQPEADTPIPGISMRIMPLNQAENILARGRSAARSAIEEDEEIVEAFVSMRAVNETMVILDLHLLDANGNHAATLSRPMHILDQTVDVNGTRFPVISSTRSENNEEQSLDNALLFETDTRFPQDDWWNGMGNFDTGGIPGWDNGGMPGWGNEHGPGNWNNGLGPDDWNGGFGSGGGTSGWDNGGMPGLGNGHGPGNWNNGLGPDDWNGGFGSGGGMSGWDNGGMPGWGTGGMLGNGLVVLMGGQSHGVVVFSDGTGWAFLPCGSWYVWGTGGRGITGKPGVGGGTVITGPDGTVVEILPDNSARVTDPDGNVTDIPAPPRDDTITNSPDEDRPSIPPPAPPTTPPDADMIAEGDEDENDDCNGVASTGFLSQGFSEFLRLHEFFGFPNSLNFPGLPGLLGF